MPTGLSAKIQRFYELKPEVFKSSVERIINKMKENSIYMNGESIERHNFGEKPVKLKYIPLDINSSNFETELLNALDTNEIEQIDNSIIELLWGDIQLGKRIQACIIMWISVYILKRPVLYIFRKNMHILTP